MDITKNKIFLTTTLPYINSYPHIGHLLEFVQADTISRRLKSDGRNDVLFNVGVDEHGLKVYEAAQAKGVSALQYCDEFADIWKSFLSDFQIKYDNFYRTTSVYHIKDVNNFWLGCVERGDLYKKKYSGLYCSGCESFKTEKDLVNGKCQDHNTEPTIVEEENWFFRISKYKDQLLNWLKANPSFLTPETKLQELINLIEKAEDISVSRNKIAVPWGIPVPGDETQVIYVWFDALLNYVFAAGHEYWAGKTIQLCGPDNIRFQGLIFQAFLASAEIKQTDKLLVHGMVLDKNGHKMSKTVGNVIDPQDQLKKYGVDAVRYYAIAGLSTYSDGCWNEKELVETYNSELADNYGNLLARVLHLIDTKKITITGPNADFKTTIDSLVEQTEAKFDGYELNLAVKSINSIFKFGNKYINDTEPWKACNSDTNGIILNNLYYLLSRGTTLLYPVIPYSCGLASDALYNIKKAIIFPRKDSI